MNTMTLSDLQNDDDVSMSVDSSSDVFVQARQRFDYFMFDNLLLIYLYVDFYQRIYQKLHRVENKNRIRLQHLSQINLMHKLEGKF